MAAAGLCATAAAQPADTIWMGGPVITMNDAQPRAEALAARGGRIVAVGSQADVMKLQGPATRVVNTQGKALLPGFVDAHGHVMMGGLQALAANMLPAPDGTGNSIAALQKTLREWMAKNEAVVAKTQLIIGFGYDNSQLAELRHPNREDLDAVSRDIPIVLVHQSGHLAAVNSKALEIGGYTASTANPSGGVIQRKPGGQEPSGVLEETAFFGVLVKLLPRVGSEGLKAFAAAGSQLWARFGYTTAQEGRAAPQTFSILQSVADAGGFKIDVAAYADVLVDRDMVARSVSNSYTNRLRMAGAKLTIDGSPQGFTAWRDRPYYKPVGNYPPGYVGYAAATPEQVLGAIDWAYANKVQLLTHANGEAASDQLIAGLRAAQARHGAGDRRHVLIHGQFLREDQLDDYKALGVMPSLFPMHTFYWGDWHRDHTVGPALADNISPTGWAVRRSMRFTTHHDAPVAFPDSMRVLAATVTRRTRSGDILGPNQRVSVDVALKAMTLWSAFQHFEEDRKGSLEVGKLADLVLLSKDPTAVDPETLSSLVVMETIKEGQTVYARPAEPPKAQAQPSSAQAAAPTEGATGLQAVAALSSDADTGAVPGTALADSVGRFLLAAAGWQEQYAAGPAFATRLTAPAGLGGHDKACVSALLAQWSGKMAGSPVAEPLR